MRRIYAAGFTLLISAFILWVGSSECLAKKTECPQEYQKVTLSKIQARLTDFAGCNVEVDASFTAVLDQETQEAAASRFPSKYKKHTLFWVGGSSVGLTYGALPKGKDEAVFDLTGGDRIRIRGQVDEDVAKPGFFSELPGQLLIDVHEFAKIEDPAGGAIKDIIAKFEQLKRLKDEGVLTQDEYDLKRKDLLKALDSQGDSTTKLKTLGELKNKGLISDAELEAKAKEVLEKM